MAQSPGVRITDRDLDIMEHVCRHRITTREAVQAMFLPEHELNAATKVLSRLAKADLLTGGMLPDGQTKYWRLSKRYVRSNGLHPYNAKPLTFGPAVEHFGVLAFCCLQATPRHLFTRDEFRDLFPDHYDEHLLRSHYYLDVDSHGTERLGLILVDAGGRDEARLVRRFRQVYRRRLALPGFRQRLRDPNRLFIIAVVVPNSDKKAAVQRAIDRAESHDEQWPVTFRVSVEPRLERMMVPYAA
ncbi:MAG: hypothetical protein RIE32_01690 [Phycisphaerales bacterium]